VCVVKKGSKPPAVENREISAVKLKPGGLIFLINWVISIELVKTEHV